MDVTAPQEVEAKLDGFTQLQIALKIPDELDVRGHGREISSGLRAFCKEISWKIVGKKISGY